MSSNAKKTKKKKAVKAEPVKKKEPEIITCKLADNEYTGIVREGPLGAQYLDCPSAKYTWQSGIKYEGPFIASQIEGKGRFDWPDGSSYVGELHCGKRHGQGLYTAKDGITKYEGQWCMGKRHGEGKLLYNADGTSFYEGKWMEGKKHGEGKQVWPSGNTYTGQWADGQMRGHGTMTWCNQGQMESYCGNWENSQPQGEGTHTWLAPEPKSDQAYKDTTSQQLNNRYKGQWHEGKRHGQGTFYYANGAYYSGEWQDHVKEGTGRHVFEDGRVYVGGFEADGMTEYKSPEPVGNNDNPVRRMVDISDMSAFASPQDCRGLELASTVTTSMYTEPLKIMREVYNMLLRYLGELKELYYRYRVQLPIKGEDPFVLSAHQFWLFARDCGFITPACSLSRLGRFVFSGSRRHAEVAPDDTEELRPLTPRPHDRRQSAIVQLPEVPEVQGEASDSQMGSPEDSDAVSLSSSAGSPTSKEMDLRRGTNSPGNIRPTSASIEMDSKLLGPENIAAEDALTSETPAAPDVNAGGTAASTAKHSKYRRPENVQNIHSPTSYLLFRQFIEAIVRIAPARFPVERNLEAQVQRVFLEIKDTLQREPTAHKVFEFIADSETCSVLEQFRPRLLHLFTGELDAQSHKQDIMRIKHPHNFDPSRRSYHVRARMDKTIRAKDLIRLFSKMGFIKGLSRADVPLEDLCKHVFADALEEDLLLIDQREHEAFLEALESGSTTPSEDDLGTRGLGHTQPGIGTGMSTMSSGMGGGINSAMGGFGGGFGGGMGGGFALGIADADEKKRRKENRQLTQDLTRGSKSGAVAGRSPSKREEEKTPKDKDDQVGSKAQVATLADFAQCDFTITPLKLLRVILEVASPSSVKNLYWQLNRARVALEDHDCLTILEFVESELMFTEFLRLLLRVCEIGTRKDVALCERLSPGLRLEGFMKHIFLPALRTAYQPPMPITPEEVEKTEAVRSAANELLPPQPPPEESKSARSAKSKSPRPESHVAEEEVVVEVKNDIPDTIELWPGFDEYDCADAEMHYSLRAWPEGYEKEIAAWA